MDPAGARYQSAAAATDDDSQDEVVPPMDNPTYGAREGGGGASSSHQRHLSANQPPPPVYAVVKKPRVPRTFHAGTTSSSSSSSSSGGGDGGGGSDYTSEYSIITRRDGESISPAHSLDDIPEASEAEEQEAESGMTESGYNVIKKENMDGYLSEAGSSEEEEEEGVEDEQVRGMVREREGTSDNERSREVVMLADTVSDESRDTPPN